MHHRACVLGVALGLVSATAGAQELQKETGGTAAAGVSGGKTDVVKEGFQKAAEDKEEERKKAVSELAFNLGGLFTAGNSRSAAVTSGVKSRLRRGDHQLSLAIAANYARSGKVGTESTTTVENVQGMARYDYFITKPLALFAQITGRHDRFQGLNLRLNADLGAAYFFIQEEKQRLWAELGYDFQYDVRRDEAFRNADGTAKLDSKGNALEKTNVVHNARLFLGFDDKVYDGVQFLASAEYLQDVLDFSTPTARLILDTAVKANIGKGFAVATGVTVRYEANPLPGVEHTDVLTGISLVYNLL